MSEIFDLRSHRLEHERELPILWGFRLTSGYCLSTGSRHIGLQYGVSGRCLTSAFRAVSKNTHIMGVHSYRPQILTKMSKLQ